MSFGSGNNDNTSSSGDFNNQQGGFGFGGSIVNNSGTNNTTTNSQATFGQQTSTTTGGFGFGAANTNPSGGFGFGAPSTTQSTGFSSPPQPTGFSFGAPPTQSTTQSTGFSFGGVVPQTTTTTTTFGSSSPPQPTTQPTGFSFGAQQPSTQAPSGFNQTNSNQTFGTQATTQQPTTAGFSFGTPNTNPSSGFSFGAQTTANTPFGSSSVPPPATTGSNFGQQPTTNPFLGFITEQTSGFSIANSSQSAFSFGNPVSITPDILIPKYTAFNFENNDYHDLSIEIYDENGLFTRIKAHRIVVGMNQGLLAQMVKKCPIKDDIFTLELSTSSFPESKFGKITSRILHHAINCYFESTYVKADDIFQVLLVMDYLQVPGFQNVINAIIFSFRSSQYPARSFVKSFNNFISTCSLPNSNTTPDFFRVFREAFYTLIKGNDFENLAVIKELRRDLFENQINKEVTATDLPTALNVIDVWVTQNLLSPPSETVSFEIVSILDNLKLKQPEAILLMIQILSSKSHFQFVSNLSPEWKLKLINKYCNCLSSSTPPQQPFKPFQTPTGQPIVQPPHQTTSQPPSFF